MITPTRRSIAALLLVTSLLSTPATTAATPSSTPHNPEIRAALQHRRDWQKIGELVAWYRRWLDALRASSVTPYTWPDCPGMRFAIPGEIVWRESRCTNAENPVSSASGFYQFVDGTWAGWGGVSHASYAPKHVQDARAAALWDGGRGACHWAPNRWC